jgi:hypothetical protein
MSEQLPLFNIDAYHQYQGIVTELTAKPRKRKTKSEQSTKKD